MISSEKIEIAMRNFWAARNQQGADHLKRHGRSLGNGGSVSANTHLNTLSKMICNSIRNKDVKIFTDKNNTIVPGRYRPSKSWDIVVKHDKDVLAVIELKSMAGESFGKNANSRAEEAVGSAYDLIMAAGSKTIERKPWMGYVFVIADNELSDKQLFRNSEYFHDDFVNASYIERIELMSSRMVEDDLYDAAVVLKTAEPPNFSFSEASDPALSINNLVASLNHHINVSLTGAGSRDIL